MLRRLTRADLVGAPFIVVRVLGTDAEHLDDAVQREAQAEATRSGMVLGSHLGFVDLGPPGEPVLCHVYRAHLVAQVDVSTG